MYYLLLYRCTTGRDYQEGRYRHTADYIGVALYRILYY